MKGNEKKELQSLMVHMRGDLVVLLRMKEESHWRILYQENLKEVSKRIEVVD